MIRSAKSEIKQRDDKIKNKKDRFKNSFICWNYLIWKSLKNVVQTEVVKIVNLCLLKMTLWFFSTRNELDQKRTSKWRNMENHNVLFENVGTKAKKLIIINKASIEIKKFISYTKK